MIARRFFLALCLFLIPGLALAQSIAGSYTAQGRNPNGSAYSGTVKIVEDAELVYFYWSVGNSYEGTGRRNGDVVTVDWGSDDPVYYVIVPSGELHGTWANGRALERLIPR